MSSDSSPSALDAFRGTTTRRAKTHPLELAALWVIAVHLCFLPWALGGMRIWAQGVSLGFGVLSLVLALWPRNYTSEHTGSNSFRLIMWPKPTTASSNATTFSGRLEDRTNPARTIWGVPSDLAAAGPSRPPIWLATEELVERVGKSRD